MSWTKTARHFVESSHKMAAIFTKDWGGPNYRKYICGWSSTHVCLSDYLKTFLPRFKNVSDKSMQLFKKIVVCVAQSHKSPDFLLVGWLVFFVFWQKRLVFLGEDRFKKSRLAFVVFFQGSRHKADLLIWFNKGKHTLAAITKKQYKGSFGRCNISLEIIVDALNTRSSWQALSQRTISFTHTKINFEKKVYLREDFMSRLRVTADKKSEYQDFRR